jgi:hypothetical protein
MIFPQHLDLNPVKAHRLAKCLEHEFLDLGLEGLGLFNFLIRAFLGFSRLHR